MIFSVDLHFMVKLETSHPNWVCLTFRADREHFELITRGNTAGFYEGAHGKKCSGKITGPDPDLPCLISPDFRRATSPRCSCPSRLDGFTLHSTLIPRPRARIGSRGGAPLISR